MTRKRTPTKRDQPFTNSGQDAVREAETRFRSLTEQWLVGIITVQAGQFKYVNPALIKMMGYSQAELLAAASVLDFVADEDRALVRDNLRLREEGENQTVNYSFRVRRKDGALLDVEVSGSPVSFEGRPAAMSTVFDVTERKRAEAALHGSEERYRSLFENMLEGYARCKILIDPVDPGEPQDFLYIDVNHAFEQLTGLKNVVGKKASEVIPGVRESNPELFEIYARVASTGKPERVEAYIEPLGRWFSIAVYSPGHEYFIAVFDNITRRKQAEAELLQARDRLQQAVSAGNVGLWDWDLRTNHVYYSPEWKRQIGYADDEISDDLNEWQSRLHQEDLDRVLQTVQTFLADQGPIVPNFEHEFRFRHKDDSYRHIFARGSLLRDNLGQPAHLLGSHVDITELKHLQQQFLQAQKVEAVGQLAGGIAHDFNNLLTVINGTADLALMDLKEGDPLRAELQEIHRAGERAASLTRQLLAFSHRQIMKSEVLNLNTVVADMQSMLRRLIGEGIDLAFAPGHSVGSVKADRGQIEQVVANLVVNARDAMPDGGRLTLETRDVDLDEAHAAEHPFVQPGPHVMLAISDTGIGMDGVTRTRCFEPFFTTKGEGKGTGLGLSTAYGIVKQSGGSIWLYSELGRGTTFKIYLPRVEEMPSESQFARPVTPARGTETILITEDEDAVRDLAKRILQSAGYTVLTAGNGGEALLLLERHDGQVHLLLTDIVMPGMSGWDLAARLADLRPQMKVLYTSGYIDDAILRHGLLDEAVHFIHKPYEKAGLTRKVRDVLDTQGSRPTSRTAHPSVAPVR